MKNKFFLFLFALLVFLVSLEFGSYIYFKRQNVVLPGSKTMAPILKEKWRNLPYPIPLKSGRFTRWLKTGELLFDVLFTIDDQSRRSSLLPFEKNISNYLLFVGCSFTFGSGVSDHETLPSQTQKYVKDHRVYNYGVGGSSPAEVYFRLKNIEVSDLKEKEGRIIYTFIPEHIDRNIMTWEIVGLWGYWKNLYVKQNNEIISLGPYGDVYPLKTSVARMILKSRFYFLARKLFPKKFSDEDLRKFAWVVELMNHQAMRLSGKPIVVLLWPDSVKFPSLKHYLTKSGAEVVDYSDLDLATATNGKVNIPKDGHPTPVSYDVVGKKLADHLNTTII
jgi:hypothetical protein